MTTFLPFVLTIAAVAALAWWFAHRGKRAAAARLREPEQPAMGGLDLTEPEDKPWRALHHRRELCDARLLPTPGPKLAPGQRPRRFDALDARRRFSRTIRSRDRRLCVLATDPRQLERYGLPCWRDERELAAALDLSVGKLRSLATHRVAERRPQYVTFEIPKRSGGTRRIHAPKRTLMQVQRKLLALLIQRLPMHEAAHGFRKGRSIKTGAQMHVGKRVILKLDVHEFFPSITFARIRGYLVAMGYGYEVACSMAVLCTEAQRQPVQVAGELVHVPVGQRHAPQGAPTSPGLSNAICMRLDRRLWGVARKHGFLYSRYADDMTFSGDDVSVVAKLCASAIAILRSEGFEPNRHKTRVLRRGRSQRVTGVTVNEKLGLSRKERRRIRAAIHQAGGSAQADARLRGKLSYVRMLNPEQAEALERQHAARQGVDAMKR